MGEGRRGLHHRHPRRQGQTDDGRRDPGDDHGPQGGHGPLAQGQALGPVLAGSPAGIGIQLVPQLEDAVIDRDHDRLGRLVVVAHAEGHGLGGGPHTVAEFLTKMLVVGAAIRIEADGLGDHPFATDAGADEVAIGPLAVAGVLGPANED